MRAGADRAAVPRPRHVADELVRDLVEVGGDGVLAVVFYGSHLLGAAPDRFSAYDFVVVVDRYRAFYDRLIAAGHHTRSPRLLAALARVLPPNSIHFRPRDRGPVAKCMILSREHFRRALGPRSPDHFVKGRMVQRVAVIHARDPERREEVEALLSGARRDVLRWAGPFLPEPFGAADVARRMLDVSYAGEVRPEPGGRAGQIFEAQADGLVPLYREVLERARAEGALEERGEGYRFARTPGRLARWRVRAYFVRSKARVTARWFKHTVTFEGWLDYIGRKIERRKGIRVELTPLERRFPLIFLWPRVFEVLRAPAVDEAASEGRGRPAPDRDGPAAG